MTDLYYVIREGYDVETAMDLVFVINGKRNEW